MHQLAICAFENTLQGDSPISGTKRITDQMHTSFFLFIPLFWCSLPKLEEIYMHAYPVIIW